jgi:hypothetical protein
VLYFDDEKIEYRQRRVDGNYFCAESIAYNTSTDPEISRFIINL